MTKEQLREIIEHQLGDNQAEFVRQFNAATDGKLTTSYLSRQLSGDVSLETGYGAAYTLFVKRQRFVVSPIQRQFIIDAIDYQIEQGVIYDTFNYEGNKAKEFVVDFGFSIEDLNSELKKLKQRLGGNKKTSNQILVEGGKSISLNDLHKPL